MRIHFEVATASHDMAQAELDEIAHRLFAASNAENGVDHKEEKMTEGKPGQERFQYLGYCSCTFVIGVFYIESSW